MKKRKIPLVPLNKKGIASRAILCLVLLAFSLLVVGTAILLSPTPLNTLFRILSMLSVAMMLLSVAIVLFTFRKEKTVSPAGLMFSLIMSLSCLAVYLVILNVKMQMLYWVPALLVGIGVGAAMVSSNRLYHAKGVIKSQANLWYLAVWGLMFSTTQLILIVSGRTPPVSLVLLLFSTGMVLANVSGMLIRYYRLQDV